MLRGTGFSPSSCISSWCVEGSVGFFPGGQVSMGQTKHWLICLLLEFENVIQFSLSFYKDRHMVFGYAFALCLRA